MNKTLAAVLAAAISVSAFAIETSIAYQGVLKNAQGTEAITGSKNITFALYDAATGGTPIWGRMVAAQLDDAGLFNVELTDGNGSILAGASNTNLVDALKAARGGTLYVGLTVDGSSGEIQPRQKILMTPYSSWAADVTNASGDFNVAGKATIKDAEVTGQLIVGGKATLNGEVAFSQGVTLSGPLTVKSTGSLSGYGTIPVGGIIMWSGSENSVPDGWALCNGQTKNGHTTPNLLGRFIVCSKSGTSGYNVNDKGGKDAQTLTESQMPSHRHWYTGDDQLGNARDSAYDSSNWGTSVVVGGYDATSTTEGSARVWKTSATGGGQAFDNRPAYYALAFIMRVK